MYSPAAMDGAAPSTVTRSRLPLALTRSTQKPLSALWNVTRSTKPASGSRSPDDPAPAGSISDLLRAKRPLPLIVRSYDSTACRPFHSLSPHVHFIPSQPIVRPI